MSYEFLASAVSLFGSCHQLLVLKQICTCKKRKKWGDPEKQGAENKLMKVIVIGVIFIGLVGSS
jgi:hypothetical protein